MSKGNTLQRDLSLPANVQYLKLPMKIITCFILLLVRISQRNIFFLFAKMENFEKLRRSFRDKKVER